jgi:hypothetical protein
VKISVGPIHWHRCAACGWDEKHQLEEKIREELANGDGLDCDGDDLDDDAGESA